MLHIADLAESMTLVQHLAVGDLLGGNSLLYALTALPRWYENLRQAPARQEKKVPGPAADEDEEDEENHNGHAENARRQYWQEQVSAVLANAMNSAPQEERQRLRNWLFLWVKTGDQVLNRIARILISHAYVMDGIVLESADQPASGAGGDRQPEERAGGPRARVLFAAKFLGDCANPSALAGIYSKQPAIAERLPRREWADGEEDRLVWSG